MLIMRSEVNEINNSIFIEYNDKIVFKNNIHYI